MEYPDNFQTPAFPAGKRIAVSRVMAIWTSVAFLLIIFMCGILFWASKSERLNPFIISINSVTGDWTIVGQEQLTVNYPAERLIQESLIGNFIKDWFNISKDPEKNAAMWLKCNRENCISGENSISQTPSCSIYCASGEELFTKFFYDILPDYQSRQENGESWRIDEKSLTILPSGKISEHGGSWNIRLTVNSSVYGPFKIEAFVKMGSNKNLYPQTMGFYIADINTYRID